MKVAGLHGEPRLGACLRSRAEPHSSAPAVMDGLAQPEPSPLPDSRKGIRHDAVSLGPVTAVAAARPFGGDSTLPAVNAVPSACNPSGSSGLPPKRDGQGEVREG